jgi:SAM-dependent methyltransferase
MTEAAASFRDPAGSCCVARGRVLRALDATGTGELEAFLSTSLARELVSTGRLVRTRRLEANEAEALQGSADWQPLFAERTWQAVYEHERIPFTSYAYEWPPQMLWQAARLTLDLAQEALEHNYGLKDATPYNVLFRGTNPVFIDVPSFKPRVPGDPVWRAYGQFVRTFLLPLLVNRRWGLPLGDIFRTRRDGLQPQEVYRFCGLLDRVKPLFFSLVSMPTWLSGRARASGERLYEERKLSDPEKAKFIVGTLFRQLSRGLDSLKPDSSGNSVWTSYMEANSYTDANFTAKEKFVDAVLSEFKPTRVLDAGANTGHFSARAAKAGAEVVAIDVDPACVGRMWQRAQAEKLNILPLVADLSRPAPALGWRYRECASFLARAEGAFDCVLMLALIHHLLVTERIPLEQILSLASELTTSLLVIEFVGAEDTMFRELTRGREHLHVNYNRAAFEAACAEHFEIVRSLPLPGTQRQMYALRRKEARI